MVRTSPCCNHAIRKWRLRMTSLGTPQGPSVTDIGTYIHTCTIWVKPPLDQVNCRGQSTYYIGYSLDVHRWSEQGVCTYNYIHLRGWPPRSHGAGIPCTYGGTSVVGAFRGSGDCWAHLDMRALARAGEDILASQRRLTSER